MNIYLDINGVILHHGQSALHVEEFLTFVTFHHSPWWLSSMGNTSAEIHTYLAAYLPPSILSIAKSIPPRPWQGHKTTGIDFTKPFRWLDDNPRAVDLADLARHDALDGLIQIDLNNDLHQLQKVRQMLSAT